MFSIPCSLSQFVSRISAETSKNQHYQMYQNMAIAMRDTLELFSLLIACGKDYSTTRNKQCELWKAKWATWQKSVCETAFRMCHLPCGATRGIVAKTRNSGSPSLFLLKEAELVEAVIIYLQLLLLSSPGNGRGYVNKILCMHFLKKIRQTWKTKVKIAFLDLNQGTSTIWDGIYAFI